MFFMNEVLDTGLSTGKNIRLISLSGSKGSGKSKFAEFFIEKVKGWEIRSFAGKLKLIAGIILNVPAYKFDDREFKESWLREWNMTGRGFLQKLGTECLRDNFDNDIWLKGLFSSYKSDSKWIVADARFRNELVEIINRGGLCVRIDRDLLGEDSHRSENEWKHYQSYSYIIDNNGSISDLETQVDKFIAHYGL